MATSSEVRAIADEYVEARAAHEPASAQALGLAASERLPDFSASWADGRRALDEATAAKLSALDAATIATGDRALHAALSERLGSDIALFDTGFTPRLLAPLATPVHEVREAFDDTLITPDDAGDAILERLASVPSALADLRGRYEWARAEGAAGRFSGGGVATRMQIGLAANQIASWIDPAGMAYFDNLATANLDGARQQRLEKAAADATRAFADLESFLRTDLLPTGSEQDAVGETVYQATSRAFLGSDLDLDEIYAFGWSELERLVAQAREISALITKTPADADVVDRAAAALDADPASQLGDTVAIREWLRSRVDATITKLDGAAFDLPADIRDVECVVTEAASGVVYYLPGAPDGSSASKIVWTIPRGKTGISAWHEVTSVHHEGVPGHHLEHSINRANSTLHPWQRYLCEIHGYAEGWAHYSEGLADELGLLESPAEQLSMVLGQIWRSVRIVVDLGLHTRRPIPHNSFTTATEWTPELGRSFLRDLARTDAHTAKFEVDRYFGWPGQALAFKVGAKLWGDARSQAAMKAGDNFDLKTFHREALGLGPMGLGPLRSLLLANS
ncbi:DUF885 domain-containing protein [Salinibacterium sp. M195]|uniref:DUF885 domain-containing protein n=1 Tax=Salinibacterium sp. M195 TaxID=2583374 RepID=UPI001C63906D|nr:DUF885 domain-containing protein [Salinibacterium sp. M195]QYH35561.1 DUF885 domain-containing protein [Salinibacterium sp. M195]